MGFERAHSESRMYFISAAHVSLNEGREHSMLDDPERGYFQHKLKGYAQFCGVDVLSYSVLRDHFYLLIQVDEPEVLTDDELIHRLQGIYHPDRVDLERELLKDARQENDEELADSLRDRFLRRMWDVSIFMKEFQLHFTKWYNDTHSRRGEFWESRFRSSVVEDDPYQIGLVASYIELAAVREKLVKHPHEDRFSSYSAARNGDEMARRGISRILGSKNLSWTKLGNRYLYWLYMHCGTEAAGTGRSTKRYAHEIMCALMEKRTAEDEWKTFVKVMRGDSDHTVITAIAKFAALTVFQSQNAHVFRLSPKAFPDEPLVSITKMKLANFQLNYGQKLKRQAF